MDANNLGVDVAKPTVCGIVMPISEIDGADERHWSAVREIIDEAVRMAGFEPRLVSDAPDAGVIQTRIIGNVYQDEIIVCDVSGRNPNVMFELGLRVAFDKPVVIIKDDVTDYSFDIGPIEQVKYPRSLRYGEINTFKIQLSEKIKATHGNGDKGSLLKSLGPIKLPNIDTTQATGVDVVLEEMRVIRNMIRRLDGRSRPIINRGARTTIERSYIIKGVPEEEIIELEKQLDMLEGTTSFPRKLDDEEWRIAVHCTSPSAAAATDGAISTLVSSYAPGASARLD